MVNGARTAKAAQPAENQKRSSRLAKHDLVPVCAWCEKVRDEHGHWHQMDLALLANTGLSLTHTICDDCKQEFSLQLQPTYAAARSGFGAV